MLLLLSILGALMAAPAQTATTASIDVIVLDETGAPLPDASVFVDGPRRVGVRTGADGRASLGELSPGTYELFAEKTGHQWRAWGRDDGPIPIALAAGERFEATLTLPRAGSITGTIVDEFGKPARALVRVQPALGRGDLVRTTQSNGDGMYRVDELDTGEYIVSALGASAPFTGRGEDLSKPIYVPVFFHNTTTAAAAARVGVSAGVPASGIDLQLQRRLPARVAGVVVDAQGQPAGETGVQLQHQDDRSSVINLRTSTAGAFETVLMSGTWTLTAGAGTTQDVVAIPGATTTATVVLQRPSRIAGRVQIAGGAPPALSAGAALLELELRVPAARSAVAVPLRLSDPATLAFVAESVGAGEYHVRPLSGVESWIVEKIVAGGREITDGLLRVLPGDEIKDLVVTLSPDAEVAGRVMDRAGAPVYRHQIIIVPADPAHRVPGTPRIGWAQPDTKGRFVVRGLPAGDYLLAAVEGVAAAGINAALIDAAAANGVRLSVPRGGRVVQDVMIAR